MTRHTIFRHYWWLAILGTGIAIWMILLFNPTGTATLIGSSVASGLAFCYFVQQQKLAETNLFKQLFSEFNRRYNELNDRLVDLVDHGRPGKVDAEARKIIVDYFNLCAEEFLYYKEGYIHRDVWRSWCRGMLWYLQREPFKSVWEDEIATESYYGLSMKVIKNGSA